MKKFNLLIFVILCLLILPFSSCKNFMNSSNFKEILEKEIAYSKSTEVEVIIQVVEQKHGLVNKSSAIVKVGYEFDIAVEANADFGVFEYWTAYTGWGTENQIELSNEDIIFENRKSNKTKCTLLKPLTGVRIVPIILPYATIEFKRPSFCESSAKPFYDNTLLTGSILPFGTKTGYSHDLFEISVTNENEDYEFLCFYVEDKDGKRITQLSATDIDGNDVSAKYLGVKTSNSPDISFNAISVFENIIEAKAKINNLSNNKYVITALFCKKTSGPKILEGILTFKGYTYEKEYYEDYYDEDGYYYENYEYKEFDNRDKELKSVSNISSYNIADNYNYSKYNDNVVKRNTIPVNDEDSYPFISYEGQNYQFKYTFTPDISEGSVTLYEKMIYFPEGNMICKKNNDGKNDWNTRKTIPEHGLQIYDFQGNWIQNYLFNEYEYSEYFSKKIGTYDFSKLEKNEDNSYTIYFDFNLNYGGVHEFSFVIEDEKNEKSDTYKYLVENESNEYYVNKNYFFKCKVGTAYYEDVNEKYSRNNLRLFLQTSSDWKDGKLIHKAGELFKDVFTNQNFFEDFFTYFEIIENPELSRQIYISEWKDSSFGILSCNIKNLNLSSLKTYSLKLIFVDEWGYSQNNIETIKPTYCDSGDIVMLRPTDTYFTLTQEEFLKYEGTAIPVAIAVKYDGENNNFTALSIHAENKKWTKDTSVWGYSNNVKNSFYETGNNSFKELKDLIKENYNKGDYPAFEYCEDYLPALPAGWVSESIKGGWYLMSYAELNYITENKRLPNLKKALDKIKKIEAIYGLSGTVTDLFESCQINNQVKNIYKYWTCDQNYYYYPNKTNCYELENGRYPENPYTTVISKNSSPTTTLASLTAYYKTDERLVRPMRVFDVME